MVLPEQWHWLGVPAGDIAPGMAVMVAILRTGSPAAICYATVDRPGEGVGVFWLSVHVGADEPIDLMYHAREILGVPADGLRPTADL